MPDEQINEAASGVVDAWAAVLIDIHQKRQRPALEAGTPDDHSDDQDGPAEAA